MLRPLFWKTCAPAASTAKRRSVTHQPFAAISQVGQKRERKKGRKCSRAKRTRIRGRVIEPSAGK